jgi:hypothetical protein
VARYVLIEFDDNKEADNFVKMLTPDVELEEPEEYDFKGSMRVRAVFFKPTQFCECKSGLTASRGKKFGLNVHEKCGKPHRGRWQHPTNLIHPDQDKTLYEQGLYLGIVEPQDGPMPQIDFLARGKALGITRR